MLPNVVLGVIILGLGVFSNKSIYFKGFLYILSILFLLAPAIMYYISKDKIESKKIDKLNKEEKKYVKDVAEKTWNFFRDFMNKENSFLPPDNFQESRREKVVDRTSSTNIGLGLLVIISAYDLQFIDLEKTIVNLENSINTIQNLEKWNGHLYNWYNTKSLKPLLPRYVSSVDSGNFIRIYVYCKGLFRGKEKHSI